jgi:2-oxoglutarate decarboxylase
MAKTATVEIQMPEMGESVTEGIVLEWHVSEGDTVDEGQTVVEISTDKVDAEVPAPAAGVITKILVEPDETVQVGAPLAEMQPGEAGSDASGNGAGAEVPTATTDDASVSAGATTEEGALQIVMPEMGESVTEGTILEWHKAEGEAVEEGETVVEVSTDKVDAEVPAPASGVITKLMAQPDDTIQVGAVLAEMSTSDAGAPSGDGAAAEAQTEPEAPSAAPSEAADGDAKATPVARRAAAANGVDLGKVTGTGAGGKITKADVLAAADGDGAAPAAADTAAGELKPLRGPAAMLASAMNESRNVPTATSFRTVAVDTLDAKRKALNGVLKERGMKVSFTHLVAWAIVRAATEWPVMVRSYVEQEGKPHVVDDSPVNLGIAVDVERKDGSRSLMVPCIKGADGLDFKGFHSYYEDLITKTRENKLTADDFQGTNISLTNPGGLGTIASVPRLMAGQGTIIATGSIAYPSEWAHATPDRIKQLGISKVMTMTSTYDHRIIQGAESGSFLRRMEEFLQGEDDFYEGVARDLGIEESAVSTAHPASA